MFGRGKLPIPRVTRWFEMHSVEQLKRCRGDRKTKMWYAEYWQFLSRLRVPVYMLKRHAEIPGSVAYPLEEAVRLFGRCFTSSVSYIIALAIMAGYERIGLWGVDLSDKEEYIYQRPAVQYLLGMAKKRGITVCLPKGCSIRVPNDPEPVQTNVLYGYDWDHPEAWWNKKKPRRKRDTRKSKPQKKAKSARSRKGEKPKAKPRKKERPSKKRTRPRPK